VIGETAEKIFQRLETQCGKVPTIGKTPVQKFQRLEKMQPDFPMIGSFLEVFSNDWKCV
jgi:hypothetical protein